MAADGSPDPVDSAAVADWRVRVLREDERRLRAACEASLAAVARALGQRPDRAQWVVRRIHELLEPSPRLSDLEAFAQLPGLDEQVPSRPAAASAENRARQSFREGASEADVGAGESTDALERLLARLELASELPELRDCEDDLISELRLVLERQRDHAHPGDDGDGSAEAVRLENARLRRELERARSLSLTDEGTGLPNRRAFDRQLRAEVARIGRDAPVFSVAIVDLDDFKAINDQFGHAAGDEILNVFARDVLSNFRGHDLVARHGGEEFAIMLPGTTLAGAERAIAKVREAARFVTVAIGGERHSLPTFSAGVAEYEPPEGAERVMDRADRAMYAAKHAGRDRTVCAPSRVATGLLRGSDSSSRGRG